MNRLRLPAMILAFSLIGYLGICLVAGAIPVKYRESPFHPQPVVAGANGRCPYCAAFLRIEKPLFVACGACSGIVPVKSAARLYGLWVEGGVEIRMERVVSEYPTPVAEEVTFPTR